MIINESFNYTENKPNLIDPNTYQKVVEIQTQNLTWNKKIIKNIKIILTENLLFFILFVIILILLMLRYFYVKNKKKKYDEIYGKKYKS